MEGRAAMSSTVERVTMTAPDISCDHCVHAIQDAVGNLKGVSRVEANEQTKRVQVEYDPRRVSLAQIEVTMEEEGYPVRK
jgi:copper chaperone